MKKIIFAAILSLLIFAPNSKMVFGAESNNGPIWRISGDNIMYEKDGEIDEASVEEIHEGYISIFLNGNPLRKAEALISGNRVLIPLRAAGEGLGASIGWNNENRTSTMEREGKTFSFKEAKKSNAITDDSYIIMNGWAYVLADAFCFRLNAGYSYANPVIDGGKNSITERTPIVYIDKITEEKPIPKEEALQKAKKLCLEGLGNFKNSPVLFNRNDMTYEEIVAEHQEEFKFIEESINAMTFEGGFSRYYKFDMKVYKVIFDKYTADMYFVIRNDAETIKQFKIDDPYLYIPLFFVG